MLVLLWLWPETRASILASKQNDCHPPIQSQDNQETTSKKVSWRHEDSLPRVSQGKCCLPCCRGLVVVFVSSPVALVIASQNRTLNAFKHSRFSPMRIPASQESVSPSLESSQPESRNPFKLRLWGLILNTLTILPYSCKDSSRHHRVDSQTQPCLSSVSKLTETSRPQSFIRLIPYQSITFVITCIQRMILSLI